ncbi:MAG: putative sulfate exporter family transporter [Archangium sp.]
MGAAALIAGIAIALLFGSPLSPQRAKSLQTLLLQLSVVGLGAGMDLQEIVKAGLEGLFLSAITIIGTLMVGALLKQLLKVETTTAVLISVGTAICGGSAIAAVAPVLGAKPHQTSVSLAVIFLLNGIALLIFPPIGHALGLSQHDFGEWAALAVHDTSSVVGATMQYGEQALRVGVTLKLARALWIVPLTLFVARAFRSADAKNEKKKFPWFILGYVAMAGLATWLPVLKPIADLSRYVLIVTLFLIGLGVSRDALRAIGVRPLVLAVVLWALVAGCSLAVVLW